MISAASARSSYDSYHIN